jgi:hypothetical protein
MVSGPLAPFLGSRVFAPVRRNRGSTDGADGRRRGTRSLPGSPKAVVRRPEADPRPRGSAGPDRACGRERTGLPQASPEKPPPSRGGVITEKNQEFGPHSVETRSIHRSIDEMSPPPGEVPDLVARAAAGDGDGAGTAVGVGSERRRDHPRPPRSTRRSRRASTPTSPRARPAAPDESSRSRDRPWAPEPRSQSHFAAIIVRRDRGAR